jgi:hypothetical protein
MEDNKYKYLKYKKKYLMLVEKQKKLNNTNNYKILLGGGSIVIGSTVETIFNDGSQENMINQCFWISILQYLKLNGHKDLTLRELRKQAGLDSKTERMMFDTNYLINEGNENIPIFVNAANEIADLYDITIEVYTVDHTGKVLNQRDSIGSSKNIVRIAQFGLLHFQLIDKTGDTFIPAVPINGELTTTTDIDPQYKQLYIELNENLGMMEFFNDHLKQLKKKYNNSITNKNHILNLYDITPQEKKQIVSRIDEEINKTVTTINNIEKKITDYQNSNLSINHIINESKCNSSSIVTRQPQPSKKFLNLEQSSSIETRQPQPSKKFFNWDPSTETRQPQPSSTVTRQPQPSSTVTRQHQPSKKFFNWDPSSSTVTRQPQPSEMFFNWDPSTETRQPQPSSTVTRQPQPSSTVTRQPQPSSTATRQHQPSKKFFNWDPSSSTETQQPQSSSTVTRQPQPFKKFFNDD